MRLTVINRLFTFCSCKDKEISIFINDAIIIIIISSRCNITRIDNDNLFKCNFQITYLITVFNLHFDCRR